MNHKQVRKKMLSVSFLLIQTKNERKIIMDTKERINKVILILLHGASFFTSNRNFLSLFFSFYFNSDLNFKDSMFPFYPLLFQTKANFPFIK